MKFSYTLPFSMTRLSFVLVLTLLTLASVARADDTVRYYDVETIIFESLDPAARNAENWKAEVTQQTPPVSVELDQPYPGTLPPQYDPKLTFKTLPASDYKLNDAEKLMVDSKQYRILLHTAWVQPGMGPKEALPVHIVQNFLSETPVTHSLIPAGPDAPPTNLPTPTTDTQTRSVLDGYIKIILTRYLHADVDIKYTTGLPLTSPATQTNNPATTAAMPNGTQAAAAPASASPADSVTAGTTGTPAAANSSQADTMGADDNNTGLPAPVTYQLHQSRKMRSNVLHYLDHPVLGMLLIISPHDSTNSTQ